MSEDIQAAKDALTGDSRAFEALVRKYHKPLFYYLAGRIGRETEAEDIVQQTFVTAYRELASFDASRSFRNWLWGIARNHCSRYWRKQAQRARLEERLLEIKEAELNLQYIEKDDEPPGAVEARMRALRQCLETLKDRDRKLIDMRFIQESPLKGIAESIGKSTEAARLLLFRLRRRLRNCVELRLGSEESVR